MAARSLRSLRSLVASLQKYDLRSGARSLNLWMMVAMITVSACGFKPMYGGRSGVDLLAAQQNIKVTTTAGREGVKFKELLEGELGAYDADRAVYELKVSTRSSHDPVIIDKNRGISRYNITIYANYSLVPIAGGAAVKSGQARVAGGHNVSNSLYSNLITSEKQDELIYRELARDIAQQIKVHFSK